jgi:hypothetical protein
MSGAKSLLPLQAFMAWTGETLPFTFTRRFVNGPASFTSSRRIEINSSNSPPAIGPRYLTNTLVVMNSAGEAPRPVGDQCSQALSKHQAPPR